MLIKDTREISEEGLKLVQTKLGTTAYLEIFNAVRQDVLEKRRERKMKRSLEVVTDPERAARKKIRHHEKVRWQVKSGLL
jgi:U3 small nucleolar RNA-associated protein 20